PRKLDPAQAKSVSLERMAMDAAKFASMHADDPMAREKLAEGIEGFSKAIEALEKMLETRLAGTEGKTRLSGVAKELFGIYDLDGDGSITREEWAGTAARFETHHPRRRV